MQMNTKMLLAALMLATAPAIALASPDDMLPGTFEANLSVANDYVFRGFTQTEEDVAVQGGLDWYAVGGVYFGASAANVKFGIPGESDVKLDVYGGYKGQVDNFSYDVGATKILLSRHRQRGLKYDWYEVSGKAGYISASLRSRQALPITPNFFGGLDDSLYYSGKLKVHR